jgi:hypothetical protein
MMSFSQREADWLGDVDIEEGVLEVLTEGFPEEHVPEGMARYEMPLNHGHPTGNAIRCNTQQAREE